MAASPTPWRRSVGDDGTVRYDLPPRPRDFSRSADALTLLAIAVLLCLSTGLVLWLSRGAFWQPLTTALVGKTVILVSLFGLGLKLLRLGLTTLPSARQSIEIRKGCVGAVSRWGPVWRSRRVPLEWLEALQVEPCGRIPEPPSGESAVVYRLTGRSPRGPETLAEGYPQAWLQKLADDLRQHCRQVEVEPGLVRRLPEVPVQVRSSDKDTGSEPQPSVSRAVVTREKGALTVTVPRPGLFGPHGSLLIFAIIPAVVAFFVGTGIASGTVTPLLLPVPIIATAAAAVGLIVVIRLATTETTLTLSPRGLDIRQKSLLYERRTSWPLAEIEDFVLGPSNLPTQKGQPAPPEIKVVLRSGHQPGLLPGYAEAELSWVAALLRQTLAEQSKVAPPGLDDVLALMPGGRLRISQSGGRLVIDCPAVGWPLKLVVYLLFGLSLLAGGGVGLWRLIELASQGVDWSDNWFGWLAAPLAALIGLAVLAEGLADSRRRKRFTLTDDGLSVEDWRWWGHRVRSWGAEDIETADVSPLPVLMTDVFPFTLLYLHLRTGKQVAVAMWQTTDEMLWLARVVRQRFGLKPPRET